ncbi:MAG: DUF86 domain-containing protein [Eggerthellaceae bacterium]|nr:DUF86 domain-containing protein [Eggerthellaceae bacterium]MBQ9044285.1 DUF86 domain-containing protein [Eggerthellaceae bacterium]
MYRIVEDVAHLSENVTDNAPDFPWSKIVGFRNFIAHGYAQIDRHLVWQVITDELPQLIELLSASSESDNSQPNDNRE